MRVLDEMNLGVLPEMGAAGGGGGLLLEQVPEVRDALLRGRDWKALAEVLKKDVFGAAAQRMANERLAAMVKVGGAAAVHRLLVAGTATTSRAAYSVCHGSWSFVWQRRRC